MVKPVISSEYKVMTLSEAVTRYGQITKGGPVVFTNGVFDILHRGHIELLERARSLGGRMVVGVNSDASVRRLGKGPDRPMHSENDRARVLAALACVDAVVIFSEDTPIELIKALLPTVLVKGGDYSVDTVVGAAEVIAAGGQVKIVPLVPGHSTTATIKRAREGS